MNGFEKCLTNIRKSGKRVILLDMAPPTHLFLKNFVYTNRTLSVESTYSVNEAWCFSNEPNDTLVVNLLNDIAESYSTYNPMVVDIETTYKITKLYGDVEKFFYYDKLK